MTEGLPELAQELVDRYTKRQPVAERHGGCGWCGGLPHSTECLVGRMETALAALREASRPQQADEEMTPHPFNLRTEPAEIGEEVRAGIWCKDGEYHRDHTIHAGEASRLASPPATTEPTQ